MPPEPRPLLQEYPKRGPQGHRVRVTMGFRTVQYATGNIGFFAFPLPATFFEAIVLPCGV